VADRVRILPESLKPKLAGRVVKADVKGSLSKSLQKAANGEAVPTPAEAMTIEHQRLLKAFRDSEGRDPNPSADPEFWDAYSTIFKMRKGDTGTDVRASWSGDWRECATELRKAVEAGRL